MKADVRVIIHNKKDDKYFSPAVLDGLTVDMVISGTAGKCTFTVAKDELLQFYEGDRVQVYVNDTPFFQGYVFTKKRSKECKIEVTAYDQVRYLKNKDSLVYKNKTATELIQFLADRFQLVTGELADTTFKIEKKVEDDKTLIDMIQWALDTTLVHTKELYVLYDKFGELTLTSPKDMEIPILIDNETACNYSYESSIDKDTYNLIKLVVEDKQAGVHQEYFAPANANDANDSETKKQWGILQYYEKLSKDMQNPQQRANEMLEFYNSVKKSLSIDDAFGDVRVRAGSLIYCKLELGDVNIASKMLVTEVKHKFANNQYTMDLKVKGGVINDK